MERREMARSFRKKVKGGNLSFFLVYQTRKIHVAPPEGLKIAAASSVLLY